MDFMERPLVGKPTRRAREGGQAANGSATRAFLAAFLAGGIAAVVLAICEKGYGVPEFWWLSGLAGGASTPVAIWASRDAAEQTFEFVIDWALVFTASLVTISIVLSL